MKYLYNMHNMHNIVIAHSYSDNQKGEGPIQNRWLMLSYKNSKKGMTFLSPLRRTLGFFIN